MKRRMRIALLSYLAVALLITAWGCRKTSTEITGPRVEIPKATHSATDPNIYNANSAVVSIPADGELYLGNARIQPSDLTQRVSALLSSRRPYDQIVYLRCGRLVKYGAVIEVIDKVREAGIHYIGFVAENDRRLPPTMLEAAILPKLTEAEMKASLNPPPPRAEIANVPQQNPESKEPLLPPPPPPPPRKNSSKKAPLVVPLSEPNPSEPISRLVVEMNKEGPGPEQTISLNGQPLPLAELETKLDQIFEVRASSQYPVYLRAPREKLYEDVVYVMDRIKGARAAQIVIHIDYLDGEGPNLLLPRTEPAPTEVQRGIVGGIPGGVPGGVEMSEPPPPPPPASKPETPTTIRMSGGVLLGQTIRRVEPAYPPIARAARVSGQVVVEVTIDEEGNVISARALSGHPLLQQSAVQAARGWKFKPTRLSGAPVKVIGTITFNFKQ